MLRTPHHHHSLGCLLHVWCVVCGVNIEELGESYHSLGCLPVTPGRRESSIMQISHVSPASHYTQMLFTKNNYTEILLNMFKNYTICRYHRIYRNITQKCYTEQIIQKPRCSRSIQPIDIWRYHTYPANILQKTNKLEIAHF